MSNGFLVFLGLLLLVGVEIDGNKSEETDSTVFVQVQFGTNLSPRIQTRILGWIQNVTSSVDDVVVLMEGDFYNDIDIILSFGNTNTTRTLISESDLASIGSEAFIVRSASSPSNSSIFIFAADGNPTTPNLFELSETSQGASYASYGLLELLGFHFLHPLQPTLPLQLQFPSAPVNITSAPRWPIRGWHYHTEHPLELMEVLQGFVNQTSDLLEVEFFMEWLVANRQNRLEWNLLWAEDWSEFAMSSERQNRFAAVNQIAADYGIATAADIGIVIRQQHAWFMVTNVKAPWEQQVEDIQSHVDWLMAAGFAFLSTESGFSEFTHPNCTQMVAWMNVSAVYLRNTYNRPMYIKDHISTGQTCSEYPDPRTGDPINFNFLPYYSTSDMGIYAHTVQMYRFDDPAPTYGNTNFTYMLDWLVYTAQNQKDREVIYHGETAYWVNYDIDSRLYDLRAIAQKETSLGIHMNGQFNFCSGWEWSYWLSDVITARAAWDPLVEIESQQEALATILTGVLQPLGNATDETVSLIVELVEAQRAYLINGLVDGVPPEDIVKSNGQSYIEGWDTWSDLESINGKASTQPLRVGLIELRLPFQKPSYKTQIAPLLTEMENNFTSICARLTDLSSQIPSNAWPIFSDLVDSCNITALRVTQVHALYDYVSSYLEGSTPSRDQRLEVAKEALASATDVVARREAAYREPLERVAGWGPNPTVYTYGYLWSVHSLVYWWRDFGVATLVDEEAALSPCYLNFINPIDTVYGEGVGMNLTELLYNYIEKYDPSADLVADCLAPPVSEPHYPTNLTKHF